MRRLPFLTVFYVSLWILVYGQCGMVKAQPSEDAAIAILPPKHLRPQVLGMDYQKPYLIDIDRPIDGMFDWFLNHRLDQAQAYGADLVIIRLTTPGGDLERSLSLARRLRDTQWATTVVWIPDEAISGGAILALGADAVFMRPTAMLGDAGPVMFGPRGEFVLAEEKIVSYTAAAVHDLAKSAGRPTAVAEAMVDRKLKVFEATHKDTGDSDFLSEKQIADPKFTESFTIGQPIAEAGNDRFLTVAGPRAKQLMLCDEVFESEQEMLQKLTSAAPRVTQLEWKDRLVYFLNRPWLTAILLVIGIVGLYLELSAPGIGLPGLVALLCFGVFFWSRFLGGTAGWLEVLLFALGITCLLMEIFVLPGFGVFGVSGLAMIAIGLVMATQDFLIPETELQWQQLGTNSITVLGAFVVLGVLIAVQVMVFDNVPGLRRFQLRPEEHASVGDSGYSQPAVLVVKGDHGVAQSDLRPSGKVLVRDQLIDVLTEGDYIDRGTDVIVLRIEGNIITVRGLNNT